MKRFNAKRLKQLAALGRHIQNIRKIKGFTLYEFADRSGISARSLHMIETGKANASIVTLLTIAEALKIEVNALISLK